MNIEFQKSIILLSIIVIFFALYMSSVFDRNGSRENNYLLFSVLFFCCVLSLWQVRQIHNWKKDRKTDYYLVYHTYFLFTCVIFLYCSYIIVSRSKLECFMILSDNMDYCAIKLSNSIKQDGGLRNTIDYGLTGYKYIWKKLLFL
jgi:hypothetical protein